MLIMMNSVEESDWYLNPVEQIERAVEKLGIKRKDVPPVPHFKPISATEVLMLGYYSDGQQRVRDTFDKLWDLMDPPDGLVKTKWAGIQTNSKNMQLANGAIHVSGLRWIGFDPNANLNMTVKSCWEDRNIANKLAHCEVLMAALLFPEWVTSWNGTVEHPFPNMAGYVLKGMGREHWESFPYFSHWNRSGELKLLSGQAYYDPKTIPGMNISSPMVRGL